MATTEDLRKELSTIAVRLADLPEDAFEERAVLRSRQHDLRQQVVDSMDASDIPALQARAEVLAGRIERALERRVDAASAGGGGESGGGALHPYEFMVLNAQIDEASGLAEMKAELAGIRARIERISGA